MSNDTVGSTVVTRVTDTKGSNVRPMMSFTAVTTHAEMANAFVKEVLSLAQKIMPDHHLTTEDLITVCHLALDRERDGVTMLEGRHLRARVSEQLSRVSRYQEPFSLIVIKLSSAIDTITYEATIDTLCERMRKTDSMFTFKSRIVLLLPHTGNKACTMLSERIIKLIVTGQTSPPDTKIDFLTCPSEKAKKGSYVLDWVEDCLRT